MIGIKNLMRIHIHRERMCVRFFDTIEPLLIAVDIVLDTHTHTHTLTHTRMHTSSSEGATRGQAATFVFRVARSENPSLHASKLFPPLDKSIKLFLCQNGPFASGCE